MRIQKLKPHPKKTKIYIQNLLLLFVSLAAVVLLTNFVYTTFFADESESALPTNAYARRGTLPDLRNEHIPNARSLADGVEISINSYGFRDHEFPIDKPEGVCRIVALGDSLTFGQGVPVEGTYSKKLEALLNRERGSGRRFEVLNAGVQGYNTVQEAIVLRHRVLPLRPDFLILGFTETNDPEIKAPAPFSLDKALGKASVLLKLPILDHLGQRVERKRTAEEWNRFTHEIYEPEGDHWKACRSALEEIRDLCRQNQIGLVVALFPCLFHEDIYHAEREQLKQTLKHLNMSYIEMYPHLLPDILALPPSTLRISETDHHPSRFVHQRFAELILQWLQERPPCGSDPQEGRHVRKKQVTMK